MLSPPALALRARQPGRVLWIALLGRRRRVGYHWDSFDSSLLGMGRLTAFLAGYMALIVVFLLARLPFLERTVGFDRLTVWHRWNGHAVIYLALAHVVCTVWGYAKQDGPASSRSTGTG